LDFFQSHASKAIRIDSSIHVLVRKKWLCRVSLSKSPNCSLHFKTVRF